MSFYSDMQATASSLLTTYGQNLTFTRETPGVFDPETGTVGTPTETSYTGYGVVLNIKNMEIDGERILQGDRMITLQNVSTVPKINDTVPIGSDTYTVLEVKPMNPAGTNLVYKLQIRL